MLIPDCCILLPSATPSLPPFPPTNPGLCLDIVAARRRSCAACPSRLLTVHQSWRELLLLQMLVPCQRRPLMEDSLGTPSASISPLCPKQTALS
ncbi:hypothetical protein IG631_10631 [Alternaria alternata]|nr:hypothetical protein IG631_10631 [Alternaria alternata]